MFIDFEQRTDDRTQEHYPVDLRTKKKDLKTRRIYKANAGRKRAYGCMRQETTDVRVLVRRKFTAFVLRFNEHESISMPSMILNHEIKTVKLNFFFEKVAEFQ